MTDELTARGDFVGGGGYESGATAVRIATATITGISIVFLHPADRKHGTRLGDNLVEPSLKGSANRRIPGCVSFYRSFVS